MNNIKRNALENYRSKAKKEEERQIRFYKVSKVQHISLKIFVFLFHHTIQHGTMSLIVFPKHLNEMVVITVIFLNDIVLRSMDRVKE